MVALCGQGGCSLPGGHFGPHAVGSNLSRLVGVDQVGTPQRLGKLTFEMPGKTDQDVNLEVPMAWARWQQCPEHQVPWTHVRAKWAATPKHPFSESPAVMFWCANGHPFEVVFLGWREGVYS